MWLMTNGTAKITEDLSYEMIFSHYITKILVHTLQRAGTFTFSNIKVVLPLQFPYWSMAKEVYKL